VQHQGAGSAKQHLHVPSGSCSGPLHHHLSHPRDLNSVTCCSFNFTNCVTSSNFHADAFLNLERWLAVIEGCYSTFRISFVFAHLPSFLPRSSPPPYLALVLLGNQRVFQPPGVLPAARAFPKPHFHLRPTMLGKCHTPLCGSTLSRACLDGPGSGAPLSAAGEGFQGAWSFSQEVAFSCGCAALGGLWNCQVGMIKGEATS
jgi:hypothetical protein